MTDYTDPESPVADPHAVGRLQWQPRPSAMLHKHQLEVNLVCANCGLYQTNHINDTYCPEWRLRQLDGDR